jgi:Domain of unknown function (DUF4476)
MKFMFVIQTPLMRKSTVLLFVFFTIALQGYSQTKVTISAPDSLPYIAVWNGVQLNQVAVNSITFQESISNKVPVQINFPSHPELNITQSIQLKANYAVILEPGLVKGVPKLVPASETSYQFTASNKVVQNIPVVLDTLALEQAQLELDAYEELKIALSNQNFEARKMPLIETYLQQHVINVDQLRFILAQISMEDRKLEILRQAVPKVTDRKRLREMTDEFLLDKNKMKAEELIRQ